MSNNVRWTHRRTSNPSELPVSVSEVKQRLRMADCETAFDSDIELQIYAAAEQFEKDCQRQVLAATYEHSQDRFSDRIDLKVRPVTAVNSVSYIDTSGDSQTLDSSEWRFDQSRQCVLPAVGGVFPDTYDDINAVTVNFTAGYGSDSDCLPRLVKQCIILAVSHWFMDPAEESAARVQGTPAYDRACNLLQVGIYP